MSGKSGPILVTGASGLLGASIVSLAQEQGREVVGLYHRNPVHIDGVKFLAADLNDQVDALRVFEEVEPSSVIHCAAATGVDWCEEHPAEAHLFNAKMAAVIARITARSGARLLYVSTDLVFDGGSGNYTETDAPAPVNVYARTKLQGEREVLCENPAAAIARVNFYGWSAQKKQSLAEWILKRLTTGNPVHGFSDVVFCPVLTNDLAEVLLALLDQNLPGLYHVVGSEAVSKYEFARRVASTFGFDPGQVVPMRLADAGLKARRPLNTSLNTEKICAALGRAMPDLDSGLRRFAQLRDNGYVDRIRRRLIGVGE